MQNYWCYIRWLFLPFALLYALVVELIKWTYRVGIRRVYQSSLKTINVGNLSTGGTGKTPHVQFLATKLAQTQSIAILSRGYKRRSTGLREVNTDTAVELVGDEPWLYKQRFLDQYVLVSEKRANGLKYLENHATQDTLVLLDDAFQHWAVRTDFHILLTTFQQPFFKDFPLPVGNLREFRRGYRRADMIVITKCPKDIDLEQKQAVLESLAPLSRQQVFFSYYAYANPQHWLNNASLSWETLKNANVLMLTGIASTDYLEHFLKTHTQNYDWLRFSDHHAFSDKDIDRLMDRYQHDYLLTTTKDASRLQKYREKLTEQGIDVFELPIEVRIAFDEEDTFWEAIREGIKKR